MRHLSDGALRRLYDEPFSLDEETRAHYNACTECQERFAAVADDARHTLALMAVPAATVDPAAALRSLKAAEDGAAERRRRGALGLFTGWRRPALGGLAAAGVAAALVGTMAFTPLAQNLVKIFQPTQVTPVVIQQGDLTGLDAFSNWGDVKWTQTPELQQEESAADAARVSGLPALTVRSSALPSGLASAPVTYAAVGQASGTVTFNGNAPGSLQGSTLTAVVGPAETVVYGNLGAAAQSLSGAGDKSSSSGSATGAAGSGSAPSADQEKQAVQNAIAQAGPILAIAEMKSPQVSSTGASVADIKKALLAQKGLSPTVRAAIESIDSPTGNLPVPVPAQGIDTQSVKVQGVNGTLFGDNTGLGSAVVWIKNGRVYAVVGTVTQDQLLAVANSLA